MTVQRAAAIILQIGVKISLQHRFAFDTGTLLRCDNYAMVNIFDDGRYYIQGDNTEALIAAFSLVETAWDPDAEPVRSPGGGKVPIFRPMTQPPPIIDRPDR